MVVEVEAQRAKLLDLLQIVVVQVADDAGEAAADDLDAHVRVMAEQQGLAGLGDVTRRCDPVAGTRVREVEMKPHDARRIVEGRRCIGPGELGHRALPVDPIAAEKACVLDHIQHGDLVRPRAPGLSRTA